MKLLIDMNLRTDWAGALQAGGHEAVHWSTLGAIRAPDEEILNYARQHGYVVLTRDLDFGTMVVQQRAARPSVVQIRARQAPSTLLAPRVLYELSIYAHELQTGAILTIDFNKTRLRVLTRESLD